MSLFVKVHKRNGRIVVAVCDKDLLGKVIEEDGKQLDLSGEFYKGEEKNAREVGDIIRNADGVNLVGEEAIKIGLEEDVIEEENVFKIKNIPHAQSVMMN